MTDLNVEYSHGLSAHGLPAHEIQAMAERLATVRSAIAAAAL
ncbi:MAG: hypothetical protein H6Q62_135, partial [Firmicutes bacterium]|nr:hypothetical protein [Bacillota bacterium]